MAEHIQTLMRRLFFGSGTPETPAGTPGNARRRLEKPGDARRRPETPGDAQRRPPDASRVPWRYAGRGLEALRTLWHYTGNVLDA